MGKKIAEEELQHIELLSDPESVRHRKNYQYRKKIGQCQKCSLPVCADSDLYCEKHLKIVREAQARQYYRDKERMKTDPEYRERQKAAKMETARRWRQRQRDKGLCIECTDPVFRGGRCYKHWVRTQERNGCKEIGRNFKSFKDDLPVPVVERHYHGVDVPAIIALHNAGWHNCKIVEELKVSNQSVDYWIKKARRMRDGGEDG